MITIVRVSIMGLILSLLPLDANASVWTARDLGVTETELECVRTAERSMETFANLFGAADLRSGRWMVALDGIKGEEIYALITCTHDAQFTRGTLVIWSARDTINRILVADRLSRLFQGLVASTSR